MKGQRTNGMEVVNAVRDDSFSSLVRFLVRHRRLRHAAIKLIEKKARRIIVEENEDNRPVQVQEDKLAYLVALLHSFDRAIERGLISRHVQDRLVETLMDKVFYWGEVSREARQRLGFSPPLFVLVSPGQRCNLRCQGCYACSDSASSAKLDWATFDRILTEKEELWGSYFTVISGGEPLMWEDDGKDLLDMAAQHDSNFFLVYTNGTLISKAVAERLAELGNVSPAISVEGFEAETDRRRGKGVHRRILQAMENLREVGVPFGISVTATRDNAEIITGDEFVNFYFDEQGAAYGWIFQYMPIGRKYTLDLMVTPEQRLKMWYRTRRLVRERKIFFADFWNSGTASNGCIAAGKPGGYLHITWNGDVTPCAFVPYSTVNIKDIYHRGGNLDDVLKCPLLMRIRRWQDDYGFAQPAEKTGNWLCPCIIRDHFGEFLAAARDSKAKPIDDEASAALADPEYHRGMIEYGREYGRLSGKIWKEHYVQRETTHTMSTT